MMMIQTCSELQSSHEQIEARLYPADEASADEIRIAWKRCLADSRSSDALFQSPEWFDHFRVIHPDRATFLVAVHDGEGSISGTAPIVSDPTTLEFSVGTRVLWKARLNSIEILGSQPLVADEPTVCDQVFAAIEKAMPDCDAIKMSIVPTDAFLWRYLHQSAYIRSRFVMYLPDGVETSRLIVLPRTFDEYLAKFSAKTRSQLKRRVRQLRDRGGALELKRYELPSDVDPFIEAAVPVVQNSWQHSSTDEVLKSDEFWKRKLNDLAQRGLLRSYILFCGDDPCAVELGYEFRGVFRRVQTHYDQRFAKLSPGTVLTYLYIQDLICHRPAKMLTFGYADAPYKAFFGNAHSDDAYVLLVRKRLADRLKIYSHSAFRGFVCFVKRRIRRKSSSSDS
jgi:CelD/BcsL family acetyltransferase involved in cellulose biosynthesis